VCGRSVVCEKSVVYDMDFECGEFGRKRKLKLCKLIWLKRKRIDGNERDDKTENK